MRVSWIAVASASSICDICQYCLTSKESWIDKTKMTEEETTFAIGIDLGTTNACVGVVRNGRVEIIANDQSNRHTPAFVAFADEEFVVGEPASDQLRLNPQNTVFDAKKLIGYKFDDPEVQDNLKKWPFAVKNDGGTPKIELNCSGEKRLFKPQEISSKVLGKMKIVAETYLGTGVTDAVITVPAYFDDAQCQVTREAAALAGLTVLGVIKEPIAAAVAYGEDKNATEDRNILIFDLGGSSLEVTVLLSSQGNVTVKASNADRFLGGRDFDENLAEHFVGDFRKKRSVDLSGEFVAMTKLRNHCEKARKNLSTTSKENINIDCLHHGVDFSSSITKVRFEDRCSGLFDRIEGPLDAVLGVAGLTEAEIDDIVLVGGASRMSKVQELLKHRFPGKQLLMNISPDVVVTHGAALHAHELLKKKLAEEGAALLRQVAHVPSTSKGATSKLNRTEIPRSRAGASSSTSNQRSVASKVAIGIDLGTTISCVAVVRHGQVEIIANETGNRITPSFVAFAEDERTVGEAAKAQSTMNPENTIFDAKRLIGRKFNDPDSQRKMGLWPFQVRDAAGNPKFEVNDMGETKLFTPEEISSMVLIKMKEVAETYLNTAVTDAVITVPAYFNDSQRQATMDAGEIAGLNVLSVLNEPTAAAIAYGVDKKVDDKRTVLIYDLGGGTFDVVILTIENGEFEVQAVDGDTFLGGGDFDEVLVRHFMQDVQRKHGVDLSGNKRALAKLRKASEQAKRNLSASLKERIQIENLAGDINYDSSITRVRFQELCSDLFKQTLDPVEAVLQAANLTKDQIDEVVLAGGSTRIPRIQELLQQCFAGKTLNKTLNPDEAVAYGAAIHAASLIGELDGVSLKDVCPLSLGIDLFEGYTNKIIKKNTRIPTKAEQYYTTAFDNQPNVYIDIYEGERDKSVNNHLLGKFQLDNIQKAEEGVPVIEVTFDMDVNGILTVTAVDRSTRSQNSLTITSNKGRLKKDQIDRMVSEAKVYHQHQLANQVKRAASNDLEKLCMEVNVRIKKRKARGGVNEQEYNTVSQACTDTLVWSEDNLHASKEEILSKRKDLEELCKAFESRLSL